MKKFLSLVLALIMTMSLVTVSAGAKDFTDDESLNYEEAVAVMSEIGVIDGYPDGSFKPQNGLTRGAAAKIICNMILGPTTAAALRADTAPFKDVAVDNQYAGYIAYCVQQGITAGYTDGTYRPAAPLTNFAFMKMLLGALGYDQNTEGYVGANCFINVAKQAIGLGLNKGLLVDFDGGKQITREEAALFAFNTLKATMVEYDEKTTVNVGGAQVVLQGKAQDVAWGTAKLNDGNIKKDGFVQFAEKHFPKLIRKDDTDAFGRPTNAWTNNKKDIGAYLNYDLLVAEYTTKVKGGEVYSDIGSVAADFDLTYYVDGEKLGKDATKTEAEQIAKKNTDGMANSGNGVLTQVFVDTDAEELTIVEINTYLAKTDDYNEKKETLKLDEIYGYGYGKYNDAEVMTLEEFPSIENYKDGDLVLVTIANGEVQTISDVEVVKGVEIDEFSKHDYVKAGDQYDYAETGAIEDESYGYAVLSDYDKNNLDDKTFNLYLDQYGYLIGIKQVEASAEYVFITAYDRPVSHLTNKTAEAKAIFTDGTEAVIEVNVSKSTFDVKDKDGRVVAQTANWITEAGDETENTWFKYTKKGDVYTLTYVTNQFRNDANSNPAVTQIDSKHISQFDGTKYFYGNADTNYILVDADKVNGDVVIGDVQNITTGVKNVSIDVWSEEEVLASVKLTENTVAEDAVVSQGVYTLTKTSGAYIIASIVLGDDGSVSDRYAYLYGEPQRERYNKSEDVYYWDMDAVIDGAKTTVTFKGDLELMDTVKDTFDVEGSLFKLSYDKDGYAVDIAKTSHPADYNWPSEFNPDKTKIVRLSGAKNDVILTAKGETLWITEQESERGYALADECPAVIVEWNAAGTEVDGVSEYATVEKAIKALDYSKIVDDKVVANFDGMIYIFFKDGIATSVILTDTVEKTEHKNPTENVTTDVALVSFNGTLRTIVLEKTDASTKEDVEVAVKTALADNGYTWTTVTVGDDLKVSKCEAVATSSDFNATPVEFAVTVK